MKRRKFDPVSRPAHYARFAIEPLDAIEAWGLSYHAGNVVKYLVRAPHKGNELQDLRKAKTYLERLIETRSREVAGEVSSVRGGVWRKRNAALREAVGAIYVECYGEAFPDCVEVRFVPHLPGQIANATIGGAFRGGEILFDWGKMQDEPWPFAVVLHELTHSRLGLDHGPEFIKRCKAKLRKYGLPELYASGADY